MELMAAIKALEALKARYNVKIYTDSQYVKDGISSWIHKWKRSGWKTANNKPVKNVDLWQELDELQEKHHIEWIWVRGHSGTEGNEQADMLARNAVITAMLEEENPNITMSKG